MGWTYDQEKAIYTDTGDGNLLVSAAAGSGKTAVLVERILQKILSGKSTIDRLLVVTFTEAAASEMRQKIVKRLYEYIDSPDSTPDQKKLIRGQIRLTQTADIMTIDSFCYRVVLNNFHNLGIDPDIQICDDAMADMLFDEAMSAVYERIYKSDDENVKTRFKRLTDFYAKDRTNDGLSDLIFAIYKFTEPFADPEKWLNNAVSDFDLPLFSQAAVKYRINYTKATANLAISELSGISHQDEDVEKCFDFVYNIAKSISDAESWDEIFAVYKEHFNTPKKREKFSNIASGLTSGDERDRIEFASKLLCEPFSPDKSKRPPIGVTLSKEEMENSHPSEVFKEESSDIAWIVTLFINELNKIKESRNLYQFSDIEQLTYKLFNENEIIRNQYRDNYDEILIDEYQDTNMLQDTIFGLISHNNIFMVGDLKQSIYRFRKGDPYIFKSKSHDYALSNSNHSRIILSQNFRSRQEVLQSVNDIFSKIMSESAGDVEYADKELIVRDNEFEYYPQAEQNTKSELHYIAICDDAELERDVCEARYTAKKIKELLSNGTKVYDKTLNAMRPIQKRDIVILENSVKYNYQIITDELARLGITSYVDRSTFFDRREISVMVSLISVINNSHNDIDLISVLRSPLGGFTDDELSVIRIHSRSSRYFIDALALYAKSGEDSQLSSRCYQFITNIKRWRDYVRKKSVAQLIWAIYEETCFYDMMGAIEGGDEAQTNLRLLYERAKQYEGSGFKGLFNFVSYIKRLEDSDSDIEGAKLINENHDVVRIMTIHKSKGLEFPYVFLLGAGRSFPTKQDMSVIRIHKDLGFGLPNIDYDGHYAKKTYPFELISRINKTEGISERMRLLYVALTRPREKLYVIIVQNNKGDITEDDIEKSWKSALTGGKLLPSDALSAKGFYSWICPAAYASPDSWDVHIKIINTTIESDEDADKSDTPTYEDSDELRKSVYEILDYTYPYRESYSIPTRTSVTQLKELSSEYNEEPDSRKVSGVDDVAELMFSPLHSKPKFMLDESEKPANEIGTLYHLIMSELDIDKISKNGTDIIDAEIQRIVYDGKMSESDTKYIDTDKIKDFFKSDIGLRMMKSCNINREKPFQINISAKEYDPSLSDNSASDTVILQGIIDCFFEESDGFVLLDYKTDKVKNGADEIKKRYSKQLELYKKAIEELTKKPVKECYLYLFDTGETT